MMKLIQGLFLAAALVAASEPARAVLGQETSLAPLTARRLAPGVHLLGTPPDFLGGVIGNVTIVEQSDGFVVIDTGQSAGDGRRVVSFIRSLAPKPVKAIVYTHWHGDHPQGASEIRAAWPGVRIISTEKTRDSVNGPGFNYIGHRPDERFETINLNQLSGFLTQLDALARDPGQETVQRERYARMAREQRARIADFRGTYLVPPNETFTDELLLDDPVRPVRLMFLGRANTDGDAVAWLPNERILASGDIVVAPIPFGFGSFPGEWIEVLERIKAMNYAVLVPGHGEPQADTLYVDRLIATLQDIRNQVRPLAEQGLTLEQIQERVDYSAQREMFGDTPRHRRLIDAFWLTPMTINAFREARGLPMIQGDESLYPSN
jgi:glyoxylase-like metal-dependent hydrolase (beta-lactamase superfamily II)